MRRVSRALAVLATLALALPLAGCELVRVHVQIRGFDSAQVEGVTFWREQDGQYVEDGRLVFEEVVFEDGNEFVHYHIERADGSSIMEAKAALVREATDPDNVQVELHYARLADEPALYKVSAFNAAGESDLTTESKLL